MAPTPLSTASLVALTGNGPGVVVTDPAGDALDAVNSTTFPNSGRTVVRLVNTVASPAVVTIATVETVDSLALAADTRTVPASGTVWTGAYEPPVYGAVVKVSGPATVKITAFEP